MEKNLQTWMNEFYPIPANSKLSEKKAIEHSILKWTGLLPENLEKHNVHKGYGSYILDSNSKRFDISGITCALCEKYYIDSDEEEAFLTVDSACENCPLYKKLGFGCGEGTVEKDPWRKFVLDSDPELMIKNLKSLLDETKN